MIQLTQITAGYPGKTVIQDITLDFLPGEVFILLGPNGSGKSTLLKAALGLLPVSGGTVLYDGTDIQKMTRKQIAQKAAFLTQSRNTPSIQALKMVLHGRFPYLSYPRRYRPEDYAAADRALAQMDALEIADRSSSNPAAHWAVYCDIQNHKVSKTYKYVLAATDNRVAFVDHRTDKFHLFVSDVFDEKEYFKGYELKDAAITSSGSPKVTCKRSGTTLTVTYSTKKGTKTVKIKMFDK